MRAATDRLLVTCQRLRAGEERRPSALPGWTVGHVLSHLARNAESHQRMALGAARGETVAQYAGGWEGREQGIEWGAARSLELLVADLRHACEQLDVTWARLPPEAWSRPIGFLAGSLPARDAPLRRLAEVEVHHVDLACGYRPVDWLPGFVAAGLGVVATNLRRRAATVGPPAAWRIRPTGGEELFVRRTLSGTTVVTGPSGLPADVVVSGPGHDVLAWLTGRAGLDGLDLEGDPALAGQLPATYPWG